MANHMKHSQDAQKEGVDMSRRNFLLGAVAAAVLTACGGSSGSNVVNAADTTPPSVRTITAPGGAAVILDANGNYVLPAVNLGTSNAYTITFDEKIGSIVNTVYLNSSGTVVTPTSVTVTVTANDASKLTYTVNIATDATYDFSVSKVQVGFADETGNPTTITMVPPVTPNAPSCTADDTANTISCGSIDPTTLEVSTNGGTSYSAFNAATTYAGAQSVLVRVKAQGINPASAPTTLNFTEVVNNESPTISYGTPVDAIFGPLVYSGGVYHANTSTGSITLGSLAVNDPDGIGSYIVTSSLFGTLASGTGAVPTTVSIPDGTGHFGQTNVITITATDTGTPTRTTTTSLTMSYDY